jgi:hypothetical protein
LAEPDGIIAFDPSSFPKRGTHSVGSSANGVATEAKSITVRSACSWAMSLATITPCSISGCTCLGSGHETSVDAKNATCHLTCDIRRDRSSVWRCLTSGVIRCRTAG